MKHYLLASLLFAFGGLNAIASSATAAEANADVIYTSVVAPSCLAVPTVGLLAIDDNQPTTLTSTATGGAAGSVVVTCSVSSSLATEEPEQGASVGATNFDGTKTSSASVTTSTSGATSIDSLPAGVHVIAVDMTASTNSDVIEAGAYTFTVPVTVTYN